MGLVISKQPIDPIHMKNLLPSSSGSAPARCVFLNGLVKDLLLAAVIFVAASAGRGQNLVAHYQLEETSGTSAADSAGPNNGTINGNPTLGVSGVFGNAFSFDGSGDWIDLGNAAAVQPSGSFTATFWAKMADTVVNQNRIMLGAADGNSNSKNGWIVKTQTDKTRTFFDTSTDGGATKNADNIVQGPLVTLNVWRFIALRYDSSIGMISLTHFDLANAPTDAAGIASNTTDNNGPPNGATVFYPAKGTAVGARDGGANAFQGEVDDVRFYDGRLSDDALATLYNDGVNSVFGSDADPPTPDPATWASVPSATSSSSITMTATTGSDASGPVEYFFDETSGNPGGTDSAWQTSPTYTDSGLSAATTYTYTVQMRDAVGNVGGVSTAASATTQSGGGGNPPPPLPPAGMHSAVNNLIEGVVWSHEAVQNGGWSQTSTWAQGQVPPTGANVRIPDTITVTVDGQRNEDLDRIYVEGTLEFSTSVDTRLKVDTLLTHKQGTLRIGSSASRLPADKTAEIVIVDRASVPLSSPANQGTAVGEEAQGVITEGPVELWGAVKTPYGALVGDAPIGSTSIQLSVAPSGWEVGDAITIAATIYINGDPYTDPSTALQHETRIITAINGANITLDSALAYDHVRADPQFEIHVANLNRNIQIRSEDTALKSRGHTMHHHTHMAGGYAATQYNAHYVMFKDLGRTDKFNLAGVSNPEARYPQHFHRNGLDVYQQVVGCSVWGSPGWGFANHSSNANYEDNVGIDVVGSTFNTEAGDELGVFHGNLAIGGKGDGVMTSIRHTREYFSRTDNNYEQRWLTGDLAHTGIGFWFVGPRITVTDNIASSFKGHGIFWFCAGKRENDMFTGLPVSHTPNQTREWLAPNQFTGLKMAFALDVPPILAADNVCYASFTGWRVRWIQHGGNNAINIGDPGKIDRDIDPNSGPAQYQAWTIANTKLWNCLYNMHTYSRGWTFDGLTVINGGGMTRGVEGMDVNAGNGAGGMLLKNIYMEFMDRGIPQGNGVTINCVTYVDVLRLLNDNGCP